MDNMDNLDETLYLKLPVSRKLNLKECEQLVSVMNEAIEYSCHVWDHDVYWTEAVKLLNNSGLLNLAKSSKYVIKHRDKIYNRGGGANG